MLNKINELENKYQSVVNEILATEDNMKIKKMHSKLIDVQIQIEQLKGEI